MKDNIAYIYGRCYGLQNTLAGPKYDPTASKIQRAVQYPMSGFALINQYLIAERKMTEEADRRIAELVDEIRELDIEPGQPEKILPLEQQNAWWQEVRGSFFPLPPWSVFPDSQADLPIRHQNLQ